MEQKVGQLFMAGTSAASADSSVLTAITDQHLGNVLLTGRSTGGVAATARVTHALQAAVGGRSTGGVGLFVAVDQEGGDVQVLRGPGFADMPSALQQGQLSTGALQSAATGWGASLHDAGVNVDLGPVMDTVPSASFAPDNPPIGADDREFGFNPTTVSSHGRAVVAGLTSSHVDATVKHFPGLGRVTGNTDTSSGVTDTVTTSNDPYLTPYADAIRAGTPLLMMSTAIYSRIDPNRPAALSPTIVTGIARNRLGFHGVVISDDLSAAQQVSNLSPAERAVDFIDAGGDIVLLVDTSNLSAMYDAVLSRARTDPAFAAKVSASVDRILAAKKRAGLI